jgi:hypothetical protein
MTSATTVIVKEMVCLFTSLALYFTSPGKLGLTDLYLISGVCYFEGKHNSCDPPGIAIPGGCP